MNDQRGSLIIEALIATLLLALAMSALMAGMIGTPLQAKKLEGKERGSLYTNLLLQELRNYVTGSTLPVEGAPGSPAWHLPGDTCPDQLANCWALEAGRHDASSLLPANMRAPPLRARLVYEVKLLAVGGRQLRQVEAEMIWEGGR